MLGPSPEIEERGDHLPLWLVEWLAFDPESVAAGEGDLRHHRTCERCSAAVEELRRERDDFVAARPAAPFLAGVARRAASRGDTSTSRQRWAPRRWFLAGGLAAAAATAVLAGLWPASEDEIRFKGDLAFTVFVSRGGEPARPLDPGETLHPGDLLRFGVTSATPGHVLVAIVDEAGRVSRCSPAAGAGTAALDGHDFLQVLPGSVELDDSLGQEWIVLVHSPSPLDARRVEEALQQAWRARDGVKLAPVALEARVRVVAARKVRP